MLVVGGGEDDDTLIFTEIFVFFFKTADFFKRTITVLCLCVLAL